MAETRLDDRGRLTLPKDIRERYGEQFRIVELHDGIKLVPVADDALGALRDEFADVEKSATELRQQARTDALDDAGH